MTDLYYDFRTGGRTYNIIVFDAAAGVPTGYSPDFFAAHSEHVMLEGYAGGWDRPDAWREDAEELVRDVVREYCA